MNMPLDIASKYNFLKQQTYENLGLVFSPGVITFVPSAPPTNNTVNSGSEKSDTTAAYSSTSNLSYVNLFIDYFSTGGARR